MRSPRLLYSQGSPAKKSGAFRLIKYVIIAAILGSIVRMFPAINVFSAADNIGVFSGDGDPAEMTNNPIGGIGGIGSNNTSSYTDFSSKEYNTTKNYSATVYSTPLIRAATIGDIGTVEELLVDNTPVNGRDSERRTALIAAAYYGQNEICSLLIDEGANLSPKDKDGFTALDFAAARGLVDTVKLLLQKSKKSDVKYHTEYAMMMQAAFSSINELMPKGKGAIPSINRISPEDKSPLHVAAGGGSVDLVTNLLNRGAKVNLTTKIGQTPLHWAALNNRTFIISLLLKKSAKINAADIAGNTPLMLAVQKNHKEAVMLLIEKGADKNLRNKNGENVATIANNKGFSEIADILQPKQ